MNDELSSLSRFCAFCCFSCSEATFPTPKRQFCSLENGDGRRDIALPPLTPGGRARATQSNRISTMTDHHQESALHYPNLTNCSVRLKGPTVAGAGEPPKPLPIECRSACHVKIPPLYDFSLG
jgi:hypothetical protein